MNVPGTTASPDEQPPVDAAPVEPQRDPASVPAPQGGGFQPETISQTPLNNATGFSPEETPDPAAPPQRGRWDTFVDQLKLTSLDTGVGFYPGYEGPLVRSLVQNRIESDFEASNHPKITAAEANQRYPDLPKPFDEPIYPETADLIASTQKRRADLQAWIAQGPGLGRPLEALFGGIAGASAGAAGGLPGAAVGFVGGAAFGAYGGAAGVVGGFANPVTLALMLATGGVGRALAPVAEIGAGGIAAVDGVVVRGAPGLVSNLAQNLAVNAGTAAAAYPELVKERQDVSLKDEALNIAGATLGGMALHAAVGMALGRIASTMDQARGFTRNMDEPTKTRNLRAAIAQHESGASTDMEPATYEMQMRAAGAVNPGAGEAATYEFKPVEHPSEITYYAARSAESEAPIEFEDLGSGVHAVDNGMVANNLAASPESQYTGSVQEIKVAEGTKFLDLESPLPSELLSQATAEFRKQGIGENLVASRQIEAMTGREVIEMMKDFPVNPGEPSPLEAIRARVQAEGYAGYKYVNNDQDMPHNGVVVFDQNHVTTGEAFDANKQITPRMTESESTAASERAQEPDNSRTYEPGIDKRLQDLALQKPRGTDLTAEDAFYKEQTTNALAQLKAAAELDPTLLEDPEYKALLHDEAQAKQEANVMEEFANCIVGDAT